MWYLLLGFVVSYCSNHLANLFGLTICIPINLGLQIYYFFLFTIVT
jgi:hypothetical protein